MPDRPPPPTVTITDPSRPAPLSDVIGEDRPDLLNGRQKRWAWVAVAVVALGAGGVWGAQAVAEQHRLDEAALKDVSLSLLGNDSTTEGSSDVTLVSTGKHPLTVLSVAIDLPHLPALVTTHTKVKPNEPTAVPVTIPRSCPAGVTGSPEHLLLRVRTYRGNETTVKVNASTGLGRFLTPVVLADLAACGPPPLTTITGSIGASRGFWSVVLRNTSGLPREVETPLLPGGPASGGISSEDGVAEPLVLPARQEVSTTSPVQLFVADCALARSTWTATAHGGVHVRLKGRREAGPVVLPFNDPTMRTLVKSECAQFDQPTTDVDLSGDGFQVTGPVVVPVPGH